MEIILQTKERILFGRFRVLLPQIPRRRLPNHTWQGHLRHRIAFLEARGRIAIEGRTDDARVAQIESSKRSIFGRTFRRCASVLGGRV